MLVSTALLPSGSAITMKPHERGVGLVATYPRRAQRDEPVALGLSAAIRSSPCSPGAARTFEVDAVLGDLVLRYLLEEQPWAAPVRLLDG